LAEVPGSSIAELRKRLQPSAPPDAKQVQRWLDDLDSKDFKARERAFTELKKHVDSVEAALRKALDDRPPLEKRQRLEKLVELLEPSRNPARLFALRGVEVLERIGTKEARKVLEELAQLQGYLVGLESQAALRRLEQLQQQRKEQKKE
jgi:threonine synthase